MGSEVLTAVKVFAMNGNILNCSPRRFKCDPLPHMSSTKSGEFCNFVLALPRPGPSCKMPEELQAIMKPLLDDGELKWIASHFRLGRILDPANVYPSEADIRKAR